jgi:hypothetical protein
MFKMMPDGFFVNRHPFVGDTPSFKPTFAFGEKLRCERFGNFCVELVPVIRAYTKTLNQAEDASL